MASSGMCVGQSDKPAPRAIVIQIATQKSIDEVGQGGN